MKKSRELELFSAKSIHRTKLDGPLHGAGRMRLPWKPTPERPFIVSASEISSFLRCRYQWNLRYRVGLELKGMSAERGVGIYCHLGKEEWYTYRRKKRTVRLMEKIAKHVIQNKEVKVDLKMRQLATAMLVGFAEWALAKHDHSDRAIGKNRVFPEDIFVLPLVEDRSILVRGKIDERFEPTVYRNVLALDETKTRKTISFDMLDLAAQMTTYLWAMWVKYPDYTRYIAWRTVMRRQMPGPRVKAALFGREMVERTPDELEVWLKDTRRIVTDMLDAAIYPSPSDSCRYSCDFYNLCLLRANRGDLKDVIRSEFTIKKSITA